MHITCLHGSEMELDALFSKLGGPRSGVVYGSNTFIMELRCHMPVLSELFWVQSNPAHKKNN